MGLVALVHWGTANPVVRYALLPVFLVFEVLFYGFLAILSERTHELFPFWTVIAANTLAAVCMGAYLWRRHPAFRESHPRYAARRRPAALSSTTGDGGRPAGFPPVAGQRPPGLTFPSIQV